MNKYKLGLQILKTKRKYKIVAEPIINDIINAIKLWPDKQQMIFISLLTAEIICGFETKEERTTAFNTTKQIIDKFEEKI